MKSGLPVGIDSLLSPSRVEGLRVEFKADWNHVCGTSALRTACAFANDLVNVNGGYIVIGVEEDAGLPVRPVRGLDPTRLDQVQKEIHGAVARIEPKYVPLIVVEELDGRSLVVLWCPAGDARPYEAPESLAKGATRRAFVRTHNGTQEAKGELARRLQEAATRLPFDDRAAFDASLEHLSPALLHEHLVQARSRLAGERLDVGAICRRLNLSRKPNGHDVPRNVALLFFSDDPSRWFPGARIEVTTFPDGRSGPILRQTFGGPLPAQVRGALDYLRGQMVDRIQKHPDRAESERVSAWPFAALEEAVVNAVHHRGYDNPEPIKIEVLPDEIRIASYPGPVDGVTQKALDTGDFPAVPSRNRRIAELLREIDLAEAARTGVVLIRSSMAENGSPPPVFRFDEARTFFEVVLPIHPTLRPKAALRAQPLRLGRPAPPDEVVGRDHLVARVWRVLETQSVALCGPTGRGVSSLLGAVAAAAPEGVSVVALDATGVTVRGLIGAVTTWLEDRHLPAEDTTLAGLVSAIPGSRVLLVLDGLCQGSFEFDEVSELEGAALSLMALERVRLVIGEKAPGTVLEDNLLAWESRVWEETVPPLGAIAIAELTRRLLAGIGLPHDARAPEIAELSAGIPAAVQHLVHRLAIDGSGSPAEVFDELLILRGDPTGLGARIKGIGEILRRRGWGKAVSIPERVVLDAVAADPTGRARLDVVATGVSAGASRLDVLSALRQLLLDGWLCEVDGRVRFEHPLVREAFIAATRAKSEDAAY